jgi:hypothetical protein
VSTSDRIRTIPDLRNRERLPGSRIRPVHVDGRRRLYADELPMRRLDVVLFGTDLDNLELLPLRHRIAIPLQRPVRLRR